MDRTSKLIGICGVRIFDQNTLHFFKTLQTESEKQGYRLISFSGNSDDLRESDEIVGEYQLFELLQYVDVCAIIILAEMIKNEKLIEEIMEIGRSKNVPIFSFERKVEGCYNLIMDDVGGFEQIVRHVVEDHQCRRVNMIAGMAGNSFSQERVDVYRKVLQENQIPFEEERVGYGDFWDKPTREVVKVFLKSDLPFPEAIVCANDSMALTTISMLNKHGMNVPEDVIVTGYDGTKNGKHFFPSLTSSIPQYEEPVKWLLEEIERNSEKGVSEPYDKIIPVGIQTYQSCGCEEKVLQNNNRVISQLLDEVGDSTWHTIAMKQLVNDTLGRRNIAEIAGLLEKYMHMWGDHYRYACIKTELMNSYVVPRSYTNVTSIMDVNEEKFRETGESWNIDEFQFYIQRALKEDNVKTIVVNLLNSGRDVYGFIMDGFEEMVDWKIQRCNELSLFLAYAIHAVIHNFEMYELNQNLQKMNQEIEELSLHDVMTGTYNRRGFFHKMRRMIQKKENEGQDLYLFFVDMDGLKYINDTFGHAEGDFAITALAKAVAKMGQDEMLCARVGGDEFICAYVADHEQSYREEEFRTQMERHLQEIEGLAEKPYSVSASVGMIAEKISEHLDLDTVIKRADDKMYVQKSAKKRR